MRMSQQLGVGSIQIRSKDREYINDILDTGRLSYGKYTRAFEKAFADAHDVSYALFCNSGTSALQVALHALKITYGYQDGDEVIIPALTFVATVNIVLQNNMKPVLVDVDPTFYEIDVAKIEQAITPRTRVIMPVHIGGLPCDMPAIMALAKKHNLQVIEDSCETMFARSYNKPVGSYGDINCFSTYVAHILSTGVGGFITTQDKNLATLCKSLFNHGRNNIYIAMDDDTDKTPAELEQIVKKRFQFEQVGYSYRATEFEAAIGLAQIEVYEEAIQARQSNAAYLSEGLQSVSQLQLPKKRMYTDHVYMFYPLLAKERDELCQYLEEHNIETRYLLPLTNQPVYKDMFNENDYPVAQMINKQGFYIGCHPGLTKADLDYMIMTIKEFYAGK